MSLASCKKAHRAPVTKKLEEGRRRLLAIDDGQQAAVEAAGKQDLDYETDVLPFVRQRAKVIQQMANMRAFTFRDHAARAEAIMSWDGWSLVDDTAIAEIKPLIVALMRDLTIKPGSTHAGQPRGCSR